LVKFIVNILFLGCFLVGTATAATMDGARHDIDQFKQQKLAAYAPMTTARAEAYLGAAMLAQDNHQATEQKQAVQRAEETLQEAQATAMQFQKTFPALIAQRQKMQQILSLLPRKSDSQQGVSPTWLMGDAVLAFNKVVRAVELGQLNESQDLARDASQRLNKVEQAALPLLEDAIQRMLSKAAITGAKHDAPVSYTKAKAGLIALKAYLDQKPAGSPKPEHLMQIYTWAEQALSIAKHAKTWRGDRGSYEMLVLQDQDSRARLADALHFDAGADDSTEALVKGIMQLEVQIQQQTTADKAAMQALKEHAALDKQQALAQLQASLLTQKDTQLSDMKEAFRAKLERETFELKRQKRLRALFPDKGVDIIVHLDGSLLIRLSKLKFASGSAKLDAKYFDLLGRLKDAMAIYGDRTFRIEGHTDDSGEVKANQLLSLHRAESVRDFLIAGGVDAASIKALGYGEVRPIASNKFAKGREMNRRIDVVIEARSE